MRLNNNDAYNILREKGVSYLYHANTVATSCTFLKVGGLLSRGEVEQRELYQTYQYTDDADKKFGVWNDIFLDGVDIHLRAKRPNQYGPVLFKLRIEALLNNIIPELWITKRNPCYWEDYETQEDRYFQSVDELRLDYCFGDFQQMITLRNADTILPFNDFLEEIIIDDPNIFIENESVFENAITILEESASEGGAINFNNLMVKKRRCYYCTCCDKYRHMSDRDFHRLFIP